MNKIVARWRAAPVAFIVGLATTVAWAALLAALLAHRSGGQDLVLGRWTWRFLIPLGVVALIFALQVWLFLFRCRQLLFTYLILAVFGLLLEGGFAWWLSSSPNQNLRALYGAAWNLGEPTVYRSHHYAIYELRPGYRDPTTGMSHNRSGFRGPEFASPKPGRVYRIFVMGGSTTYTIAVKDNRRVFTYLLERALNREAARRAPGWRIEVVNAGVGGYTSAENLLRLIFRVGPRQPDLVMIQQGLNDVWPLTYDRFRGDFGNYRKSWYEPGQREAWWKRLARASNVLTFVLARLGLFEIRTIKYFATRHNTYYGGAMKQAVPRNLGPFRRNTELMILAARRLGAKVILVTEPYLPDKVFIARRRVMPWINSVLAATARKFRVKFFDLWREFPRESKYYVDSVHLNAAGNRQKAALYRRFLEKRFKLFDRLRAGSRPGGGAGVPSGTVDLAPPFPVKLKAVR